MKRKWLLVLASTMLVTGVCFLVPKAKEVKATTVSVKTSEIDWGEIPTTDQDDVVFAGWYADEDYTTPLTGKPTDGDTLCYAKWVDQNVLSVKLQAAVASENQTKLRLLSSVDTLNYKNVGFEIYFTPEGETERKTVFTDTKVLKEINAVHTGVTYEYSPKVISADSEYFITGTMTKIADKNLDRDFYVKPFWTTCDGTKVYGVSRMFAINDCIGGDLINVSVKDNASGTLTAGEAVTVTIGTGTTTDVSASVVGERDGYVHLNVAKARTDLDSTTKVTYNEESTIYQNLLSKSTADTSWYDADPDADKYVLTTAADLKGVQAKGLDFANKEIYLVTDVALSGQWTPITSMAGTFDGQGHTISGLKSPSGAIQGMFASVSGTVQNFILSDSSFAVQNSSGAIVGSLSGELNSIYVTDSVTVAYHNYSVDGVNKGAKKHVGGLVGQVTGKDTTARIENCGFAGTVKWLNSDTTAPTDGGHGGIVGLVDSSTCELVNCMMSGTVEKGFNVGGLIGFVNKTDASASVTIRNCLVTGTVSGTRSNRTDTIGTIVGANVNSTIYVEDVYTAGINVGRISGDVIDSATTNNVIDGIGLNLGSTASYIYGLTNKYEQEEIKGSAAWNKLNLNFYSEYNEDGVWVAIDSGLPKLKIAVTEADTVLEEDYTGTTAQFGWYNMKMKSTLYNGNTNTATELKAGTIFEIETAGDLLGWNQLVNNDGVDFSETTVRLTDSVNLNPGWNASSKTTAPVIWNAIGAGETKFEGTFDGGNNTISGVYVSSTSAGRGMFSHLQKSAIVKDFNLSNSYMNCVHISGAIVGQMLGSSELQNVHVDNTVYVVGTYAVGGLVGQAAESATQTEAMQITGCTFAGEIDVTDKSTSTKGRAGGIIGDVRNSSYLIIDGCTFTGCVTGVNPLGGIAGIVRETTNVTIQNSKVAGTLRITYQTGSTTVSSQVGRLIGHFDKGTVNLSNVDRENCICYKADGTTRSVDIGYHNEGNATLNDLDSATE